MKRLTENLLVPTDFSDASLLAVRAAKLLAQQNDAKLTLCHVYDARGVLFGARPGIDSGASVGVDEEARIHEELRKMREGELADVENVKTALVLAPNPSAGIVDYAAKEDVDMIVISTHGRTGLTRALIGSVAERVVRHAHCPVLTLRSHAKD